MDISLSNGHLVMAGGNVVQVRTTAGDLHPGAVVLATGLALEPWVRIPQRLVKGHLVATARGRSARAAAFMAPGLASDTWCGFRPATADGRPAIDRVPGLANAWVSAGHDGTGLLLAPATGRALASWIATGRRPSEVNGLNLARFARRDAGAADKSPDRHGDKSL